MTKWYWRAIIGAGALGLIVVIIMLALPKPPIPGPIKSQLTSTLMLPAVDQATIDRASTKYDASLKVLTFTASTQGKKLIISEQPTPDQFTDVPQVYQKVLDGMNDYADFDVNVGSVHLTQPPQLHGGQTAVLNAKGTLIFAKPSGNLSQDQWRQFFTSFNVVN